MITDEDIRAARQESPCFKCGEMIPRDSRKGYTLTCYRGEFISLHNECADFIDHATKGPRGRTALPDLANITTEAPELTP